MPEVAATAAGNGLVTYREAAAKHGTSVRTIKRLVRVGSIAPSGVGRGRKIVESSLDAHFASQRLTVKSPAIFMQGLADERNRKALMDFLRPVVDALVTERLANRNVPPRPQRLAEIQIAES